MLPFHFGGEDFALLPERAVLWQRRRALIVADLHLEKASWFARHGQHLPPYDSQETLRRLLTLADAVNAREIWALGDNFHDADGPDRLDGTTLTMLEQLATNRRMLWITGNHDHGAAMPGESMDEAMVDGIVLRHHASDREDRAEISGHFHPSIRIETPSRSIRRACAVVNAEKLIVPAFGSLTGTLDCRTGPIRKIVVTAAVALVATKQGGRRFALA